MCRATPPSIYVLPFLSVDGFVASAVLSHLAALRELFDVGVGFGHCGWFCGWLVTLGGCVVMRWFVCLFICVCLGVEYVAGLL